MYDLKIYWYLLHEILSLNNSKVGIAKAARNLRLADLNWQITLDQSYLLWKELFRVAERKGIKV